MTDLQISGKHSNIFAEKELLIYRIAQEALRNCIRHAQAKHIQVSLDYSPVQFRMKIADDGVGFDRTLPAFREGLGLKNMYHRAEMLGGELTVDTKPDKGCVVRLDQSLISSRKSGDN